MLRNVKAAKYIEEHMKERSKRAKTAQDNQNISQQG